MRRLFPLIALEVFVWLGLLLCMFLISKVVYHIGFGPSAMAERMATIIRDAVSAVIALAWLFAWKEVTTLYLWRALNRRRVT